MQVPRVRTVPGYASSRGVEAIELAASAGLILDPWQELVLVDALGCRGDGKWAAFEVGVNVSRQNGKGGIIEGRELAGLFVFGERLILHSAHEFATATEARLRMEELLEGSADLSRQVKSVNRSHGAEGFTLKSGQRLQYRTRTKGGGRGFGCDGLILDEAMVLPEAFIGALLPTLSARSMTGNPQVFYAGSPVDQQVHEHGVVFARVRERGLRGDDPSLAYFEWSAADAVDGEGVAVTPESLDEALLPDAAAWADANPGLGIRISGEHVAKELRSMDARTFAVERLGVGDWPRTDGAADTVISMEQWLGLIDVSSEIVGPVCLAFDVSPSRSWASIAAAGRRQDGLAHVEIVDRRRGTAWLPERLAALCERHEPDAVVCDAIGPAGSIVHQLAGLNVEVETVTAREHANGCGLLFDLVEEEGLRHLGTAELIAAVKGGTKRQLGDAWAWSRKSSQVDISPLVAATLALFSASQMADWGERDGYVLDTRVGAAA